MSPSDLGVAHEIRASQMVVGSSISALTFVLWEMFLTLDDEMTYIWRKPTSSFIKWVYLWIRWSSIVFLISVQLIGTATTHAFPVPQHLCRIWYLGDAVFTQIFITSVEMVLMSRIYALYQQSLCIRMVLALLVIGEFTAMTLVVCFASKELYFRPTCTTAGDVAIMIYYAVAAIFTHVILLSLSLYKYYIALRDGWGRMPIVHLMMHDGTVLFLVIIGILMANSIVVVVASSDLSAIAFFWFIAILSVSSCRTIVRLQRLAPVPEHLIILTTHVFGNNTLFVEESPG